MAFSYLVLASALHDERSLAAATAPLARALDAAGGVRAGDAGGDDPLLLVALTGGTERAIITAAAERDQREPVVVVAHPAHNSLPAAMEAVARLRQDGRAARIIPADGAAVRAVVHDLAVAARLRATRVGVVGAPSDWLVASMPDAAEVSRRWGPALVPVDLEAVMDECATEGGSSRLAAAVRRDADERVEPTAADVDRAADVLPALATAIDVHHLDAITVRCFDLIGRLGTTGCIALAELNDAGFIAGCEGDVASVVGMLWTALLLDAVPWMANPAWVDREAGTVLLAHCTVPRSLVRRYRLRSHFESGQGVGLQGDLRGGPVTLVRVGGTGLERLWVAEGTATAGPHREGLCRTQATVTIGPERAGELLDDPLGNHLVLVHGHHAERLLAWRALVG